MSAYNVINRAHLVTGQPEDVSDVLANFDALAVVVNALDNSNIAPGASVAYSKLNLLNSIVNADVAATAAIAVSKLAAGSAAQVLTTVSGVPTWAAPGGAAGFGTTLPSTPNDGDEYYYIADSANNVIWHLKYRSSVGKWAFVGGAPLYSEVVTAETYAGTTYSALTTAGPVITLPNLSGDYMVAQGFRLSSSPGSGIAFMSYDIGATGASDNDCVKAVAPQEYNVMRQRRKSFTASTVLTAKYRTSSQSLGFGDRWMMVWPG